MLVEFYLLVFAFRSFPKRLPFKKIQRQAQPDPSKEGGRGCGEEMKPVTNNGHFPSKKLCFPSTTNVQVEPQIKIDFSIVLRSWVSKR